MGQPYLAPDGTPFLDPLGFPFLINGPLYFPKLVGTAWPVLRAPGWDTLVQRAYNGKKTTLPRRANAIYEYTLDVNLLRIGFPQDFQAFIGFVNSLLGQHAMFFYDDPKDDAVTDQLFGAGDGVTTDFQLYRSVGYTNDIVQMLRGPAPVVKDNGVPVAPGDFTIDNFGVVHFTTAPAVRHALSWSGGYYWLCQMTMDKFPLNEFTRRMFEIKKLTFETVIL